MHSYIINIKSNLYGYYITINIYNKETKKLIDYILDDELIADYLGLSLIKYTNMLISKYNAYICNQCIYIKNEEDIIKLKKWLEENIEQLIIVKLLTNNIVNERK
jgi:hypothetical protein